MGTSRALAVALTLSLSGNVALFCWARGRTEGGAGDSVPVGARPSTPRSSDRASGPTPTRPPKPEAAEGDGRDSRPARPVSTTPVSVPMPRGLDWCGTGREAPPRLLGPKWRLEEFDDGSTRVRMANDEAWNALLAKLATTDLAGERLSLMRSYLVARAGRFRRADVAELAHCLGTLELASKVPATWIVERLYLAASALRRSVNENWLTHLDPAPPPPPPASTPPKGD